MIRPITERDIPDWEDLIKEVEPLFGPMLGDPGFLPAITQAIQSNAVFGYEAPGTRKVVGVVAIGRETNSIEWLAVSEKLKNGGIGSKLIEVAISELDSNADVIVQTFAPEIEAGSAARKLYLKFGFTDWKNSGENPAGINTVLMVRKSG